MHRPVKVMFYVYTLSDPRDSAVFYVGKGNGSRAWQHAASVRNGLIGCNAGKEARIADIQRAGYEPAVKIVYRADCEQDAFDTEADLIACSTGLTNIMAGGGRGLTPHEAALRLERRQDRAMLRKIDEDRAWLRQWLAAVETWAGVAIPGLKNGEELAREFVSAVKGLVAHPA